MTGSLPHRAFKAEHVIGEESKAKESYDWFPATQGFQSRASEHVTQVMKNIRRGNSNRRIGEYHVVISKGVTNQVFCIRVVGKIDTFLIPDSIVNHLNCLSFSQLKHKLCGITYVHFTFITINFIFDWNIVCDIYSIQNGRYRI